MGDAFSVPFIPSRAYFNQPVLCRGPKIGFPNTASHHNFFILFHRFRLFRTCYPDSNFLGCHLLLRKDILHPLPCHRLSRNRFVHLTLSCQIQQGQGCWNLWRKRLRQRLWQPCTWSQSDVFTHRHLLLVQIVWQCTRSLFFNCCLFLTLLFSVALRQLKP